MSSKRRSRSRGRPTQKVDFAKNNKTPTKNFNFPAMRIEDIDRAVFNLFDKQINIEVSYEWSNPGSVRKVPVIFATGERFALTRRDSPLRDDQNTLILPVISIMRQDVDFSPGQGGKGTAIAHGEQPGYYIKKRLAEGDRNYQNIMNMHLNIYVLRKIKMLINQFGNVLPVI